MNDRIRFGVGFLVGFLAVTLVNTASAEDLLEDQIDDANKSPDISVITLEPTRTYVNPLPCITSPVVIEGNGALVTVPIIVCGTEITVNNLAIDPTGNSAMIILGGGTINIGASL
jgi:hypothetical protein